MTTICSNHQGELPQDSMKKGAVITNDGITTTRWSTDSAKYIIGNGYIPGFRLKLLLRLDPAHNNRQPLPIFTDYAPPFIYQSK